MLVPPKLARKLHVDTARLQVFIKRSWLSPLLLDRQMALRDVDTARAALIMDLADNMGINDEGVDLVLDLLDQLYSLRFVVSNLISTLEAQPVGVKRQHADD